ncbi:hypothetical protein B0H13DRAFT_1914606 [Mycena leptocephala]|nr:hypothetical protein B0H13DRAFT_1914606 [Mycena leptocephala]
MYVPSFIESDAAQFLDLNWIEVPALRKFLEQKISIETPHASGPNTRTISVKSEPQLISLSRVCGAVKLRTLNQGGREILKLLSESEAEDSDPDCDVEVTAALMRTSSRSSSTIPQSGAMDTLWKDEITSFVRTGQFSVTQKLKVQRIEYLPEPPIGLAYSSSVDCLRNRSRGREI